MSLRERKKSKVRAAIVEAALDLFERQGFAETSVDEIAAAAEVSRRTVFRYFASKEDLVFLGQAEENRLVVQMIRDTPRDADPIAALLAGTRALLATSPDTREQMVRSQRIIAATPALAGHRQRVLQEVRDILVAGVVTPRMPKREALRMRLLVNLFIAGMQTVLEAWLEAGARGALDEGLALVEELIRHGFQRAKGSIR